MKIPAKGVDVDIRENTLVISSRLLLYTLSSAVAGGGFRSTRIILNTHVSRDYHSDSPETDLQKIAKKLGVRNFIGMMTAVNLENVSVVCDGNVTTIATGGVSNATAVGEKGNAPGTINIVLVIDANLTESAMVNAIITATEAKTLALRDLNIKSKSGEIATGTSTDAIVVACTKKGGVVKYCGSATPIGGRIGRATRRAVREAIAKQDNCYPFR